MPYLKTTATYLLFSQRAEIFSSLERDQVLHLTNVEIYQELQTPQEIKGIAIKNENPER